jgi:hypothetical protein
MRDTVGYLGRYPKCFAMGKPGSMVKKTVLAGCSKTLRYKAPDNLHPPPAGRGVRRTVQYVATTCPVKSAPPSRYAGI